MIKRRFDNDMQICAVVRLHDENGDYGECFYDEIDIESLPDYVIEALVNGESVLVDIAPFADAIYFANNNKR